MADCGRDIEDYFNLSTDVEQNVASRGELHVDVGHGARFLGSSGEIHHLPAGKNHLREWNAEFGARRP